MRLTQTELSSQRLAEHARVALERAREDAQRDVDEVVEAAAEARRRADAADRRAAGAEERASHAAAEGERGKGQSGENLRRAGASAPLPRTSLCHRGGRGRVLVVGRSVGLRESARARALAAADAPSASAQLTAYRNAHSAAVAASTMPRRAEQPRLITYKV